MAQGQNIFRDIKEIAKRIGKLERVKQLIGADIVQIVSSTEQTANTGSLAAGAVTDLTFTITPTDEIVSLWDFLLSVYVDTDDNANYLYPSGGSLSAGQMNFDLQWGIDYTLSSDTTGERIAKVVIKNNDGSAHTYYVHAKFHGIKQGI